MEHRYLMLVAGVVVALLTATTPIDAEDVSSRDRFKLWNACKPVNLYVDIVPDDVAVTGLTLEAIATTVRSRLRAARLYDDRSAFPALSMRFRSAPGVVVSGLEGVFLKIVSDPISGEIGSAITWSISQLGRGGDATLILALFSQLTDRFIDDYLRVNGPACQRSPIDP